MPANPKVFIHGLPIEITTSVRRGLPFPATPITEAIVKGALAAAQNLYGITICHYLLMANHIHLLCVVVNPQDIASFMNYFKTEVAHSMNRLLGRTGTTFWEEGYDSPIILSAEKCLDRMNYIYSNPVKAGLVTSIDKYPGINSFSSLDHSETTERCKKIPRNEITLLPLGTLSIEAQEAIASRLKDGPGIEYTFRIGAITESCV